MGAFVLWYDPEKLGFCYWYCINLCSLSLQMSSHRFARSGSQSSSMELRCTISRESRDLSACHHKEAPLSVRSTLTAIRSYTGTFFWTSSDVSSVFQSQSEQHYSCLAEAYMLHVPWDSPLVQHLLTSWWPAWQPSRYWWGSKPGFIVLLLTVWDQAGRRPTTELCRLTQELSTSMSNQSKCHKVHKYVVSFL